MAPIERRPIVASDTLGKPVNVGLSDSPVSARNGRFTQVLTAAEAVRRGPALEREGIAWLEEPIRHDDYRGNGRVCSSPSLRGTGQGLAHLFPGGRWRIKYAIRLPANQVLQDRISYLLKRPVGRPPNEVRRFYANFTYQAGSWTKPRRVIAKVEWNSGELYPRVGFIVTNMSRPAEWVVAFYNKRGTCEQWIKEGKGAIKWTRLSYRTFAANARASDHPQRVADFRRNRRPDCVATTGRFASDYATGYPPGAGAAGA